MIYLVEIHADVSAVVSYAQLTRWFKESFLVLFKKDSAHKKTEVVIDFI